MHGITQALNVTGPVDLTITDLNNITQENMREKIDMNKYVQTPGFTCYGSAKYSDDIKGSLEKVNKTLLIASQATGEKNLPGLYRGVFNWTQFVFTRYSRNAELMVVTRDPRVKQMIQNVVPNARFIDPSEDAVKAALDEITNNAGVSEVVTMCHGKRVRNSKEKDGYAGELILEDYHMPDKLLTDSIERFKGQGYIGIFEHCHAGEIIDEGLKNHKKIGTIGKIVARGGVIARSMKTENVTSTWMVSIMFAITNMVSAWLPKLVMPALQTNPFLITLACTGGPVILGCMVLINGCFGIVMQTLIPVTIQLIIALLNNGKISADLITSIPYTLGACLFLSFCGTVKTYRATRKWTIMLAAANSLSIQGGNVIRAGGIVTNGVYTDIGMNMSSMVSFSSGFSVYYYPIRLYEKNKTMECIISTQQKGTFILKNTTDLYIVNKDYVATCNHTIFRGEVQKNMNASTELPFGNIKLFKIGKTVINMSAYNSTMSKYMYAIGALKEAKNLEEMEYTLTHKDWMKGVKQIKYNDTTEWNEPNSGLFWLTSMLTLPAAKTVGYFMDLLPNMLPMFG